METLKNILAGEDTVDLTPMIDVTFLLLIYFMVTTMLKQPEAALSIQLPGKPQSSDLKPMEMCKVKIGDEGEVYLNGSEIEDGTDFAMPDLVGNLKQQKGMRLTHIHRTELSGPDQPHTKRPSGFVAGVEFIEK